MKAQSTKHFGSIHLFTPGMFLFVLLVTTVAFGIILLATTDSVPVLTSSTTNEALIAREAAKDVWLERGGALGSAPYNVQVQEALKDAKMEKGLFAGNEAFVGREAAKDAWLERGIRNEPVAYSVERQEALKDAKIARGYAMVPPGADNVWVGYGPR